MTKDSYAIEIDGLWAQFGKTVIHRDINLQVQTGEVLAIIGGSGSGKTTLLRQMLGLDKPARGKIKILGCPVGECAKSELVQSSIRWGVLFQAGALFSALNVFDNVALPLRELKWLPKGMIYDVVMTKLALVGIDAESATKMPAELSGGMVKRVALARALALDPELLFLDEPTAGLDPARSHSFVNLIEALRRELRLTVVMVTHDVDMLMAIADRVAVLADQQLVTVGPLWEVVCYPHPFVQNFFLGHSCGEESVREFRSQLTRAPPSFIDQVGVSAPELLDNVAQAAKRVNTLLSDDNLARLTQFISNLDTMSGNLAALLKDFQPVARTLPPLAARADTTLRRMDPLLTNLNGLTTDVRSRVTAFDRVSASADEVGQASRALREALTHDTLPRLHGLSDELSRSSRAFGDVLRELREQPQSLIFGKRAPSPGPGEPGFKK